MDNPSEGRSRVFHHKRLKSPRAIRLAILLPAADFESQLRVSLFETELNSLSESKISYEALSYVWGSGRGTRPLMCNNKTLLITSNCESALWHLRSKDGPRTLWVDSICINQAKTKDGLAERATQVPLMGEIFANATRTLCWLGKGQEYSGIVMHHLEQIGKCSSHRGLKKLMRFEDTLRNRKILAAESSCLDHIFCHPWHSRIWTTQEVAFSSDCRVICGKSSVSWEQYSMAAEFLIYEQFLEHLDLGAAKSMASIDMRNTLRNYLAGRMPSEAEGDTETSEDIREEKIVFLTSCLTDLNQLKATDPKDKIYGLYSVYSKLGVTLPAVDYRKSVAHVYTDAAVAMISWSASLLILRDACSINKNVALPSWVPDWNDDTVRLFMPASNATKNSRIEDCTHQILSPVQGELHARGKMTSKVVFLTANPVMMPFPTHSNSVSLPIFVDVDCGPVDDVEFLRLLVDKIRFFRALYQLLKKNQFLSINEHPSEVFLKILSLGSGFSNGSLFETWIDIISYPNSRCDQSFGHNLAETWRAAERSNVANWTSELMHCTTIAASLLSNSIQCNGKIVSSHGAILDLVNEMTQNMADQAVIMVQHDSSNSLTLGTTFQSVSPGDVVVLLEGAEWPVVLRKNGTKWSFVGPAFVLGMMDGEAWLDQDGQANDLKQFILT